MPLDYEASKTLVSRVVDQLFNRVANHPTDFLRNYNAFTLKRDILMYMVILQERLGTIEPSVLCFLIAGYYGDEADLPPTAERLISNIIFVLETEYEDLLTGTFFGDGAAIQLTPDALKAIKDVFAERFQTADVFNAAGPTLFDFVAEANLIEPHVSSFPKLLADELRRVLGPTLKIEPIPNSARQGELNGAAYDGELFHLSHNEAKWHCILAVVANQGAFTQAFLEHWALRASNARTVLQNTVAGRINILLIASDSSDTAVTEEAVDIPYFYHAWPMAAYGMITGLKDLADNFEPAKVAAQLNLIFPDEMTAHFLETPGLERIAKKLQGR